MVSKGMFILLLILLFLLYLKWIVFVLMLPVIRTVRARSRRRASACPDGDAKLNSVASPPLTNAKKKRGLLGQLKRYVGGYIRYADFQTGLIPSHHVRDFLYRHVWLVDMAPKSIIYWGAEIRASEQLHIGEGSIIGDKSILDARRGGIFIGKNVNFGSGVHLWTGQHDYKDPYFRSMPGRRGPIRIGDRAWLGANVTVLHSVTIGEGAVVATGAVVTKDVEPYTLVGGIPAKKIGERPRDLRYEFPGEPVPFY